MDPAAEIRQQGCSCGSASSRCWCLDCDEALCDVCLSAHRRVTVTRSHRILNQPPAGDVSTPPIKFCRLHPSEPLKLYCFTCNELTCRDCQLAAHMNHRYQFVKEALVTVKQQLENRLEYRIQPITAQRNAMRRSLMDMKTRLHDISESRSNLRSELQQSFSFITDHLMKRKEEVLKQAEEVSLLESKGIKMRITKTMQLWKNQLLMMKIIEKAQKTNDLSALATYAAQVDCQLKECPDLDVSPPLVMSNLKVVTERTALEAVLRFGALEVKWIPFSVSKTTNQKPSKASSSSSSTSTSTPATPPPAHRPLPQTRTTVHSPVAVGCSATTSTSSSNGVPSTSTCGTLPQNGNTGIKDSPVPVSRSKHLLMLKNPSPVNLPPSSDPSPVLKPVQPSLAAKEPTAPQNQNQSSTALLQGPQTTSCFSLLSVMPPFPIVRTPMLPENTWLRNQKILMGDIRPEALPAGKKRKMNPDSGGPSGPAPHRPLKDVGFATTSSPPSCDQRLTPDTGHPSHSLKDQQQSPVVRAVADSACDRSVQPVGARRPEPYENEPTSTVSEEPAPAGKPEPAPEVSDTEPEPSDTKPAPAPEVSDTEPEPAPEPSDTEPEPAPEVSDTEPEPSDTKPAPAPEVSDTEPEPSDTKPAPAPEVSDTEPEPAPEPSDTEPEPAPEPSDTEPEPVPEPSDTEPEPAPEVSDTEPEPSDTKPEPVPEVSDTEPEEPEPSDTKPEPSDTEPEPAPEVSDTEPEDPEPSDTKPEPSDTEPEPEVSDTEPEDPEPSDTKPEPSDTEPEHAPEVSDTKPERCSVIGHPYSALSQWQPRVSLFRLPVTPPRPGRPSPCFVLVPGEAEDEIYLKEMSEDTEPGAGELPDDIITDDIITELPASPDSPVTLVTVSCSACQEPSSSIICSSCGRGYHRHCHAPPVGPALQSEWICSLCQDLLDPSDPYSSDRPPRPQSPCLSLQDQRRCETLLLLLKVEGCARLPQSQLTLMSERLSLRRSPSYGTAAEFVCDAWSLFPDASQDDDVLNRLKENLRSRLASESMSPGGRNPTGGKPAVAQRLRSGASDEGPEGSKVKPEGQEGTSARESNAKETRKRLRNLLDQVQPPRSKRTKTSDSEPNTPPGDSGN